MRKISASREYAEQRQTNNLPSERARLTTIRRGRKESESGSDVDTGSETLSAVERRSGLEVVEISVEYAEGDRERGFSDLQSKRTEEYE